jgi:hypothetical protein
VWFCKNNLETIKKLGMIYIHIAYKKLYRGVAVSAGKFGCKMWVLRESDGNAIQSSK